MYSYQTCGGLSPTILGTGAAETITGTSGDDVILGGGGDDVIHGMGGNDVICGGGGNDRLNGGSGHDILLGGPGDGRAAQSARRPWLRRVLTVRRPLAASGSAILSSGSTSRPPARPGVREPCSPFAPDFPPSAASS